MCSKELHKKSERQTEKKAEEEKEKKSNCMSERILACTQFKKKRKPLSGQPFETGANLGAGYTSLGSGLRGIRVQDRERF